MDIQRLRSQHVGRVLVPGDDGYDAESASWNLLAQHRPAAVAISETANDVAAAVTAAAHDGIPIAVQATGHGPAASVNGALLINTSRLTDLDVQAQKRTARVGAGVRMGALVNAAARSELAPLAGSAIDVSVVGYLTGGGLPVLGRRYGFAADHVREIEMVTADGKIRTVNAEQHPDLFWAVRGSKSNFGIVTSVELDLIPLKRFYGGVLAFPGAATDEVLRGWIAWCNQQPDEMCSSIALMRVPDAPAFPEPMRGQFVIFIRIACTADKADAEAAVKPLRAMNPTIDAVTEMTPDQIGAVHNDPTEPLPVVDRATVLGELDDTAIERIVELAGPDAPDPVTVFEIRHMGGALSRPPKVPNALGRRTGAWCANIPMLVADGRVEAAVQRHEHALSVLQPWICGALPNFLGMHSTSAETRSVYTDADFARLQQLKRSWDPQNLFSYNPNIPPAAEPR